MHGVAGLIARRELRRVLVVKLSSLGDIVHVTPCLRAIRQAWPRAEIVMAVERRFADVVRYNPHLDGLVEADLPAQGSWGLWQQARGSLRPFRAEPFDMAVDFQGNSRSALWVYASGAAIKAGRGGWRPRWQAALSPDLNRHAVIVCAAVAGAIGVAVDDLSPQIAVSAADDHRVCTLLQEHGLSQGELFLANPFSRWSSKEWPAAAYAETLQAVRAANGAPWVVTCGPDEEERAEALVRRLPERTAVSLAGLSLGELLCLLRKGKFLLTGDTGPMHVAAAFGVPVVALFGPTWPERTGPWGPGHVVLQARRPPSHHTYMVDHAGAHMAAIKTETVVEALRSLLGRAAR